MLANPSGFWWLEFIIIKCSLCIGVSSLDFFMEVNAMKTPMGN